MNKNEFLHGKFSIVRTLIAAGILMSILSGCVEVNENQTHGIIHDWQFTPLQAGLWDKDHPYLFDGSANAGLVFAPCGIAQRSGVISLSCFNQLKSNYGLQMALWDAVAEDNYGVSMGVYSVNNLNCGICIGAYSISWAENWGLQMGLISASQFGGQICGIGLAGLKIALINYSSAGWLDIGLFNDGDALLQIGVLNHNERALIPWFPLINIGVGKKPSDTPSSDTMEQVGSRERDHNNKQQRQNRKGQGNEINRIFSHRGSRHRRHRFGDDDQ